MSQGYILSEFFVINIENKGMWMDVTIEENQFENRVESKSYRKVLSFLFFINLFHSIISTCAISAYHHYRCCEFEARSWRGFLHQLN
jgi:hypothetical protein